MSPDLSGMSYRLILHDPDHTASPHFQSQSFLSELSMVNNVFTDWRYPTNDNLYRMILVLHDSRDFRMFEYQTLKPSWKGYRSNLELSIVPSTICHHMVTQNNNHPPSCPTCEFAHGKPGSPHLCTDGTMICKTCNSKWRELAESVDSGEIPKNSSKK